jgi:hypothetical protein
MKPSSHHTIEIGGRLKMNKDDCIKEKISSRVIGLFILGFSLILAFVGFLLVPIFGLFFAIPIVILGFFFIFAPESKVCRLLLRRAG